MKIHLANSDERLALGTNLFALCDDLVPKAEAALMWDDACSPDYFDFLSSFPHICRRCRSLAGTGCQNLRKRYVYGLIPGQEGLIDERQNPSGREVSTVENSD